MLLLRYLNTTLIENYLLYIIIVNRYNYLNALKSFTIPNGWIAKCCEEIKKE